MKNLPLFATVCLLGLVGAGPLAAQQLPSTDAVASGSSAIAQDAVNAWLSLTDSGQYHQGWDAASNLFKKAVTEAQWTALMNEHRAPLAKLLSRKFVSSNLASTLPGAPAGKYVVTVYAASFEHKKTAVETVTAVMDSDGLWRVSGYMVK